MKRKHCWILKKHKVSFEEAKSVFYDDLARLMSDPDHSERERRYILLGLSKIVDSMGIALRKRPVSAEAVEEAIRNIEERLLATGEKEIASDRVGELVMRELKRLDKVAYIRFASVYKSFADIESFESALKELK